jgi:hypothetical protein
LRNLIFSFDLIKHRLPPLGETPGIPLFACGGLVREGIERALKLLSDLSVFPRGLLVVPLPLSLSKKLY